VSPPSKIPRSTPVYIATAPLCACT